MPATLGIPGEWAPQRLLLYRALLAMPGFDLSAWPDRALQALPLRLGELAEGIPFAFDDDLSERAHAAVGDLVDLLRRRRESTDPKPAPAVKELDVQGRALRPRTCSLGLFREGTPGLRIAARALRLDATLDSGVIEAWVPRGHGGPLFDQLVGLYAKLRAEDERTGPLPAHLILGLLGTLSLLELEKESSKALVSRLWPPEKVDRAVSGALFALVEAALEVALGPGAPGRSDANAYAAQARAVLGPLAFLSMPSKAPGTSVNPWGLPESFVQDADRLWLALLEEDPRPRAAEQRLEFAFEKEPSLRQRMAQLGALLVARRCAFNWLALYDGHDPEVSAAVSTIARSDDALCAALADPKPISTRVVKLARGLKPDDTGNAVTLGLLEALRKGPERPETVREVAAAYATLALDRVALSAVESARARLKDRRCEYTRERLVADYLAGRLYRLSADAKPIRRALARKAQGHLFVDFDGLSRHAYRNQEPGVAELARAELFEPLLAAACQHAEGLGGALQLELASLREDAAVFSGEVGALVALAADLPAVCRRYAEKLRTRSGVVQRAPGVRRAEVEAHLRRELDRLRGEAALLERAMNAKKSSPVNELERALFDGLSQRNAELETRRDAALQRGDEREAQSAAATAAAVQARQKALFSRIETLFGPARDALVLEMALAEDQQAMAQLEQRAAETRRWAQSQLRALDGEASAGDLECGVFISYGPAAETAPMLHPRFGRVQVTMAEAIREAELGASRHALVKTKLDALLREARSARALPHLELPFRVYVGSADVLLVPPNVSERVELARRERDAVRARDAAQAVCEELMREVVQTITAGDGRPLETLTALGDIYNAGEALSSEALAAYLVQSAPRRTWFRKTISVEDLDPEFRDLFVFPESSLELIASVLAGGDAEQAVLFRRVGPVQLAGLEGRTPTVVWELVRKQSPFALLLAQKHLLLWGAQARGRPPGELPK